MPGPSAVGPSARLMAEATWKPLWMPTAAHAERQAIARSPALIKNPNGTAR